MKPRVRYIMSWLLLLCGTAFAQDKTVTIQGTIQDAFLERGLMGCTVKLLRTDSTEVKAESKVYEIGNNAMQLTTIFYITAPNTPGDYLIRVTKEGYDDGWTGVTIPQDYKQAGRPLSTWSPA